MKKNNMKLSALVLTSVLSLSLLTACTQNAGTAAAPQPYARISRQQRGYRPAERQSRDRDGL